MSRRRFLPTDAFVDESIRGQRYLMGCVLVEAKRLPNVRKAVQELALDGNRIHFHNESKRRRQLILGAFVELPLKVDIVLCQRRHGVSEFDARNACLKSIVERLQTDQVPRLTLESRDDDSDDVRTISRTRSASPSLVYEHRSGELDPLLWVADGLTWAAGAGTYWRELIGAVVREERRTGP
jgi:hypothetical protein